MQHLIEIIDKGFEKSARMDNDAERQKLADAVQQKPCGLG